MRPNSFIMLGLAVLCGGGAVLATKSWISNQQFSPISAVEARPSPNESVIVAAVPLRFGDKIEAEKLKTIAWPNGSLPTGAFGSTAKLLEEGDRFVLTAMEANEPLLSWKITGPGQRATLSAVVDPGKKAVTIRVNDVLGVAGFVLPGDRVDIMLTRSMRQNEEEKNFVDVLLQGVKVLAIDQVADNRTDDPVVVSAVSLEVDTEQAQKLTLAANIGQLSLALRNVAQDESEPTRRITMEDLNYSEVALDEPEPAEPEEEAVAAEPAPPPVRFSTIAVIRGTERSEYQVQNHR